MARSAGRLVCTRSSTGSGSFHAKMSGHDTISTLSTVVGADVGSAVGEADGASVGADVGDRVGAADGAKVGTADGARVGVAEGDSVGAAVGDLVGICRLLVVEDVLLAHSAPPDPLSNTYMRTRGAEYNHRSSHAGLFFDWFRRIWARSRLGALYLSMKTN